MKDMGPAPLRCVFIFFSSKGRDGGNFEIFPLSLFPACKLATLGCRPLIWRVVSQVSSLHGLPAFCMVPFFLSLLISVIQLSVDFFSEKRRQYRCPSLEHLT